MTGLVGLKWSDFGLILDPRESNLLGPPPSFVEPIYHQTFDASPYVDAGNDGDIDVAPVVTPAGSNMGVLGVKSPASIVPNVGVGGGSYYSGDTPEQASGASTGLGSSIGNASNNLGTLSQFSITFWIDPTHISTGSSVVDRIFLLGARTTSDVNTTSVHSVGMTMVNTSSNGALPGQLDVWGKGVTATNQIGVSGTQVSTEGGWYFVALTYDGTSTNGNNSLAQSLATGGLSNLNGQIYLGAAETAVTNYGVGITTAANNPAAASAGAFNFGSPDGRSLLVLGNRQGTTTNSVAFDGARAYNGYLDDFRIYNSLLNHSEIDAIRLEGAVHLVPEPSSLMHLLLVLASLIYGYRFQYR